MKKRTSKGQAAIEYLVVSGALLVTTFAIIPFIATGNMKANIGTLITMVQLRLLASNEELRKPIP